MSFYGITADYNGPLKQVNAHTDDDRYGVFFFLSIEMLQGPTSTVLPSVNDCGVTAIHLPSNIDLVNISLVIWRYATPACNYLSYQDHRSSLE